MDRQLEMKPMQQDTNFPNDLQYREGVGILLLNEAGDIFVGKRTSNSIVSTLAVMEVSPSQEEGVWQMPQGGIDKGEEILDAALRELQEETGAKTVKVLTVSKDWYYYDFPPHVVPYVWEGRYIGQKQKWVVMQFSGEVSEFNLSYHAEKEFDDWKWASPHSILKEVVHFKANLYKKIFQDLDFI